MEEGLASEERKALETEAGQGRQWKRRGGTDAVGGVGGGPASWQMDVGLETGQEGPGAQQ